MRTVSITGGMAHLREKEEIRVRHRRLLQAAYMGAISGFSKLEKGSELETLNMAELGLTKGEALAMAEVQDAAIVASLAGWSLDRPIPTLDTIGDLDMAVYDELAEATKGLANEIVTGTDFAPPDPSSAGFEGSPTVPSAASNSGLGAEQESSSTSAPSSSGMSTSTVEGSPASPTSSI